MARTSTNSITSLDQDWGNDPQNGLPFSGRAVQTFIKNMFNEKVGAGWFDSNSMTLWLFRNEEDKEAYIEDNTLDELVVGSVPLSFSTLLKRIRITPQGSTSVNATINQDNIDLAMEVAAESRELGEEVWLATGQDIMVKVYLDAGNTGNYEEIVSLRQKITSTEGRLSINIKPFIQVGANRVRFYFYAEDDITLSNSVVWTVTLAQMYIEELGNTWNKALIEGGSDTDYHLGGFKIVGSILKTIHILISTAHSTVASYAVDLGASEYFDSPFYFTKSYGLDLANPTLSDGTAKSALTTGVYGVMVWLTAGDLTTYDDRLSYNIMYVAQGDANSAELVVMNNAENIVDNFDESAHLCDYAIYSGGHTYATPTITILLLLGSTISDEVILTPEVTTGTKLSLIRNISLLDNSQDLYIHYIILMSNTQLHTAYVNNLDTFPSAAGTSFYLNTSVRSNGDSDKEILYNSVNNLPVEGITWTKMSWVDGIDGWTVDDEGRRCLMLPARSKLTIPSSTIFLTGDTATYEFCFKVKNVSDYSENIITIASNIESANFSGIRIKPTNVTIHSSDGEGSANDVYQGTNFSDEELVHLVISICKNFDANPSYNLVTGYINGVKAFQFSYPTGTLWANMYAETVFGSDSADLYLYLFRVYGSNSLSSGDVESNWVNSLEHRLDKVEALNFLKSVLSTSSRLISYEVIKDNGLYNFFVVEMTGDNPNVPSYSNKLGGFCNVEMHYGKDGNGNSRSAWDWKIYDVECKGQGTTSMDYWKWNIRWRIDKSEHENKECPIAYYDDPVISGGHRLFVELPQQNSKTVIFDGQGNHPAVKRITAKINFASSMLDHKMGATRAYDFLHNSLENGAILNEAQQYAQSEGLSMPTVAVYQYPAFGFQKNVNNGLATYTFLGLFTIGPDKGDKPTFGYDLKDNLQPHVVDISRDLISLEGTDHSPQMTKFGVPWDDLVVYNINDKGDAFLAVKAPRGNFINALEVGNVQDADTEDSEAAMPILEANFKDAYSVIYNNSTLIVPVYLDDNEFGGLNVTALDVLTNINNDPTLFRQRYYQNRISYEDVEFWIEGEYILYHYETESGLYESGYKTEGSYHPLNLVTDTGVDVTNLTVEEANEAFKAARRARFLLLAPLYWNMTELAFNYAFMMIFAATDNFAKNQYPIYMGGKWGFRQDDLDTILDIDNDGAQKKPSYIEYEDVMINEGKYIPYFAGSNSVLWNLVNESMWDDFTVGVEQYSGIRKVGKELLELMAYQSGGSDIYDGFIKFFDLYFWRNALEYFPPSAYNIDGKIKYEAAWLSGESFPVDPLRQSLGSHYLAEILWTKRRAIYCMSLFQAGAFSDHEDSSLGQIVFRPSTIGSLTVTPAYPMYPGLIIGDGNLAPTSRTFEGEQCTFDSLSGDGTTRFYILAIDYLTSIGDLKDLVTLDLTLSIFGKKLKTFKMGDSDPTLVTTTMTTLTIGDALPCLETLDLSNATYLQGSLDLRNCKRLKEIYTEGTLIQAVYLPRGSKIETLHLSDGVTQLSYQVVKYLSDLDLPGNAAPNITLIYLELCDALDGMETLYEVFSSNNQSLQFIKIIKQGEDSASGLVVNMLASIQLNKDKDGNTHIYKGVNLEGGGSTDLNPQIECSLLLDKYYQSDLDVLISGLLPTDSITHPGMKEFVAEYFGPLHITYPIGDAHVFIPFEDAEVKRICLANWSDNNNGYGITPLRASQVTGISTQFARNTTIVNFDELRYFTGININAPNGGFKGAFLGCTNLKSVMLPEIQTTITNVNWNENLFRSCSNLERIYFPYETPGNYSLAFNGCSKLKHVDIKTMGQWANNNFSTSTNSSYGPFDASKDGHLFLNNVEIKEFIIPDSITQIKAGNFRYITGITSVDIPSTVTSINGAAFYKCTNLATVIIRATTPPTLSNINAFQDNAAGRKFYVPNGCKSAYTTDSDWNSFSEDTFIELDENGNIPI